MYDILQKAYIEAALMYHHIDFSLKNARTICTNNINLMSVTF